MTNSSLSRLQTHKSDQKHKIPSTFKCVLSQKRKGESQSDSPLQPRLNYLRLHSNPQAFDTYLQLLCDHGRPNRFFSFFLHASCMLRDAILFFIKGCHAKANVRPVMPFHMFFELFAFTFKSPSFRHLSSTAMRSRQAKQIFLFLPACFLHASRCNTFLHKRLPREGQRQTCDAIPYVFCTCKKR